MIEDFVIQDGILKEYKGSDEDIVIPEGVTKIAARFAEKHIKSLEIPGSVKTIGNGAFYQCKKLKTVKLKEGIENIEANAFSCCGIEEIYLPGSLKNLEILSTNKRRNFPYANIFSGCKNLKKAVLGEGIEKVDVQMFSDCKNLKEVQLPSTIKSIEDGAFECNYYSWAGEKPGKLKSINLPEGLEKIGDNAFSQCEKLSSLNFPKSIKTIGENAFYNTGLEELILPPNIEIIKESAFDGCKKLENLSLPENLTTIKREAFSDCKNLKTVKFPKSLKKLESMAFSNCQSLEKVEFAEGLETLSEKVFWGCLKLLEIAFPKSLKYYEYLDCSDYKTKKGEFIYEDGIIFSKKDKDFILCENLIAKKGFYEIPEKVDLVMPKAFNNCNFSEVKISKNTILSENVFCNMPKDLKLSGDFLLNPNKLPAHYTEDPNYNGTGYFQNAQKDTEVLVSLFMHQTAKSWKEALKPFIEKLSDKELILEMLHITEKSGLEKDAAFLIFYVENDLNNLDFEMLQHIYKVLKEHNFKANKTLFLNEAFQNRWLELLGKPSENLSPMEKLVKDNWKVSEKTKLLKKLITKGLPLKDSEEISSIDAVIFVLDAYMSQMSLPRYNSEYETDYVRCNINPIADKVASNFKTEEFLALLENLAYDKDYKKEGFLLPFGRYANGKQILELIKNMKDWDSWYTYGGNGRRDIIIARGALMLSDTKEAMFALDKIKNALDNYAQIRNTDADTLRDTVLVDFGFDEDGKIVYDLLGNKITVSINSKLELSLFDENAKKEVKSIPKKKADPLLLEKAKEDFSLLKKNIKNVKKNRTDKFFEAFLSGKKYPASNWKEVYLKNPVLNALSQLMVWQQAGITFTVLGKETIKSDGSSFELSDNDIVLAHPCEMEDEDIKAWQDYFVSKNLSQPFMQIWEPKIDPKSVKKDRYKDCKVSVFYFINALKHGISSYGIYDYSEDFGFKLTDCDIDFDCESGIFFYNEKMLYTLGKFKLSKYSRYSNHIMYLLDKWTIKSLIAKDDIKITERLYNLNISQVMDYINFAIENKAVNCTALLMNYKNQHFEDFDPLMEFSLEDFE